MDLKRIEIVDRLDKININNKIEEDEVYTKVIIVINF